MSHINLLMHCLQPSLLFSIGGFADDTKLGGLADTLEGYTAIQQDLDRLRWKERNLTRFNKVKCRALHPRRKNCMHQYRLGTDLLERSSAKKDLRVLVGSRLAMRQQCVLVAK